MVIKNLLKKVYRSFVGKDNSLELSALTRVCRFLIEFKFYVFASLGVSFVSGLIDIGSLGLIGAAVAALGGGMDSFVGNLPKVIGDFVIALRGDKDPTMFFVWLIMAAISLQLVRSILAYSVTISNAFLVSAIDKRAKLNVVRKILLVPYGSITKHPPGMLSATINHAKSYTSISGILIAMVLAAMNILVYGVFSLSLMPEVFIVLVVLGILFWIGVTHLNKAIRSRSRKMVQAETSATRWAVEFFSMPRLLRIYNGTESAYEKIRELREKQIHLARSLALFSGIYKPIVEFMMIISIAVSLLTGVFVFDQATSGGIAHWFVIIAVIIRTRPNLDTISQGRLRLSRALAAAAQVEIIHALPEEQAITKDRRERFYIDTGIEFQNVGFRYSSRKDVFDSLSLSLEKGKITALVGRSGTGKSTIVNLLLGLYKPASGQILVDGIDLSEIDMVSWRELIGIVDQETFLLSGTIAENIAYGRETESADRVVEAARIAYAHDFIEQLPNGYDTEVGQYGGSFSGGEKQRLAIARALLRNPKVLIMDEPTSSLDAMSENLVTKTLKSIKKDRVTLIIAHRFSTIKNADEIYVLEDGMIVEKGSYKGLIDKRGTFASLWEAQT